MYIPDHYGLDDLSPETDKDNMKLKAPPPPPPPPPPIQMMSYSADHVHHSRFENYKVDKTRNQYVACGLLDRPQINKSTAATGLTLNHSFR